MKYKTEILGGCDLIGGGKMNTENEIYCEIEYSCDDTSGLLNHALGISGVRKRLKKKHGPIDSANRICLKTLIYGLVIFIIAAVCYFIQLTRAISPYIAILGAIYVLLALLGLLRYFKTKKSVKTLSRQAYRRTGRYLRQGFGGV